MNIHVLKLAEIAKKKQRRIIGLMSGTSLDGLDVALCTLENTGRKTKMTLDNFATLPYNTFFKDSVRNVFSKRSIDLEQLCILNKWIAEQHAAMLLRCLGNWQVAPESIDLVASHGQTVYHSPAHARKPDHSGNATLQIGDGDHLAVKTGIITISDFRQKHIAAGGEGAPLAAYGDYFIFGKDAHPVILLNIGGIANFTYLQPKAKIFSSDIGPGNTLMDAWMQKNFSGFSYDENAIIGFKGTVHERLLAALKKHSFFDLPLPKTTGPELFNLAYLEEAMATSHTKHLSIQDVMATLNKFTADCITAPINELTKHTSHTRIYVSGGGLHNPLLFQHLLKDIRNAQIDSTSEYNINPDAKEAMLFALLANECIAGSMEDFPMGSTNFPPVSMGKISFPG
jgi:anhydro-N-acetylmuramic acid kinase